MTLNVKWISVCGPAILLALALMQGTPPITAARGSAAVGSSLAQARITNATHLVPVYINGKTYLFELGRWWVVNDDPAKGIAPARQDPLWSANYLALRTFTMNDRAGIFGLHTGVTLQAAQDSGFMPSGSVGANVWLLADDPAKGFQLSLKGGKMSRNYRQVVTFQANRKPYVLGLHEDVGANIWRLKESGRSVTMELAPKRNRMSRYYSQLEVFYMDGHPYLFGLHQTPSFKHEAEANIWRVKEDPFDGIDLVMKGKRFHPYDYVRSFRVNDRPYLLTVNMPIPDTRFESVDAAAAIWEIMGPPGSPSLRRATAKSIPMGEYLNIITFEQNEEVYVLGVRPGGSVNIWRVNENPDSGITLVYRGDTN
ncbi:MAG: hypothetical protein ABFD89_25065 [Bryobacteraceae bacterium]